MPPTRRNNPAYVKKQKALRRQSQRNDAPCHLCGKSIDYTLPYTHAMSFTADHITAVAAGGHMLGELAPAHRACNSRRGARTLNSIKPTRTPRTSRDW